MKTATRTAHDFVHVLCFFILPAFLVAFAAPRNGKGANLRTFHRGTTKCPPRQAHRPRRLARAWLCLGAEFGRFRWRLVARATAKLLLSFYIRFASIWASFTARRRLAANHFLAFFLCFWVTLLSRFHYLFQQTPALSAFCSIPAWIAFSSARPCSAANFLTSSVIFMEQKCGLHMEQKCAVFAPSWGKVSS